MTSLTRPRLILARIRTRSEDGTPGDPGGDPQWFLAGAGRYFPLRRATTSPGFALEQLAPVETDDEPSLRRLEARALATVLGLEMFQKLGGPSGNVAVLLGPEAGLDDVRPGDFLAAAQSIEEAPDGDPAAADSDRRAGLIRELVGRRYESFCEMEGGTGDALDQALHEWQEAHGEIAAEDLTDKLVWQALLWGARAVLDAISDLCYDRYYAQVKTLLPDLEPVQNPGWTEYEILALKAGAGQLNDAERRRYAALRKEQA